MWLEVVPVQLSFEDCVNVVVDFFRYFDEAFLRGAVQQLGADHFVHHVFHLVLLAGRLAVRADNRLAKNVLDLVVSRLHVFHELLAFFCRRFLILLDVPEYLPLDVRCSLGILERIHGFLQTAVALGYARNHRRLGVPS